MHRYKLLLWQYNPSMYIYWGYSYNNYYIEAYRLGSLAGDIPWGLYPLLLWHLSGSTFMPVYLMCTWCSMVMNYDIANVRAFTTMLQMTNQQFWISLFTRRTGFPNLSFETIVLLLSHAKHDSPHTYMFTLTYTHTVGRGKATPALHWLESCTPAKYCCYNIVLPYKWCSFVLYYICTM